ncbi:MAG: hypothetical protein LBS36_01430 [Oscillospiraceae bacterium]|jgi:hypothetical protein|nr:hypothetical protein [Oscillospiraceae bacterium]
MSGLKCELSILGAGKKKGDKMKKRILLIIIFILLIPITTIILSIFMPIKLSTVELPNPGLTYFIRNTTSDLALKLPVSAVLSAVITAIINKLWVFYQKRSANRNRKT